MNNTMLRCAKSSAQIIVSFLYCFVFIPMNGMNRPTFSAQPYQQPTPKAPTAFELMGRSSDKSYTFNSWPTPAPVEMTDPYELMGGDYAYLSPQENEHPLLICQANVYAKLYAEIPTHQKQPEVPSTAPQPQVPSCALLSSSEPSVSETSKPASKKTTQKSAQESREEFEQFKRNMAEIKNYNKIKKEQKERAEQLRRTTLASLEQDPTGSSDSFSETSRHPRDDGQYIIPMLWNQFKNYWFPQPVQLPQKVYSHANWLLDLAQAKTDAELTKIQNEYLQEKEKERKLAEQERIAVYNREVQQRAQHNEQLFHQGASKKDRILVMFPLASMPLKPLHHAGWQASFSAAESPEGAAVVQDEFRTRKAVARQIAELNRIESYNNDPRRFAPRRNALTIDVTSQVEEEVIKQHGQNGAEDLWRKATALEQARAERQKAEHERDLVLAERARAQHVWDFAEGKVDAVGREEKERIDETLSAIPSNIEEVAKKAAKEVEKLKKDLPIYQGKNPPDSPHAAERREAAERLRRYQEAEAKKMEHLRKMEESDALPYRFKAAIQEREDERSGKNLLRRLIGLIGFGMGAHSSGGSFPQPIPVPLQTQVTAGGAATARGTVSSGWLAGLNSRIGSLFVFNGSQTPQKPGNKSTSENKEHKPLTNKEAKEIAKKLGYFEDPSPPFNAHGKKAFKLGNKWISPDRHGHKGGVWKMFEKKGGSVVRTTWNKDLTEIIGK